MKNLFVVILLSLVCSCNNASDELIEFSVSEGVINDLNFDPIGFQEGDKLPKIFLYTLEGDKKELFKISENRPILVVTGSYTCDITRAQLPALEQIKKKYQNRFYIVLVNTLEAHPESSQSPYSAEPEPWPSLDNIREGVQAEQPRTMLERRQLAERWISEQQINVPVLLDGPKNEFWKKVGQAPNMAILVSPEGVVLLKQAWFAEQELLEAIEKIL